jgi:protein-S-isoprenylcysteine O-methyltransferase Ste14
MSAAPRAARDSRGRRLLAVMGSAIFFVIAPGTVWGLVPWWLSGWRGHASLWGFPLRVVGSLLIIAGVLVVLDSFARFALHGLGTPAPVFPTRHLVVGGLYRYVRNPIYVAGISVIVGQALYFGSLRLLEYAALVWLGCHVFVLTYEEPKLRATFGAEYENFCAHVPRWLPRLRPWQGHP